jgi:aldose sugar dehydrogenase
MTSDPNFPIRSRHLPGRRGSPRPQLHHLNIETITTRLTCPWSIAFLPDGNFLVTESVGFMRIVRRNGVVSTSIGGVPPVKVLPFCD